MAVRVTLLHNPGAGFERYTPEELIKQLKKKGYKVNYSSTKEADYEAYLRSPGELVVVAGGDGTVHKTAEQMIGRGIPIGLLPLGTANNIATTLNISGEPSEIISGWDLTRRKPFDVGVLHGPEGKDYFIESVGLGLLPKLIKKREKDDETFETREEELQDALVHQQKILKKAAPFKATIQLEEQQVEGDFLMVEIMNIKFTGPNLCLAPHADPGDGWLDVVLLRGDQREKFSAYLESCLHGEYSFDQFEVYRAKNIEVVTNHKRYHIDDETERNTEGKFKVQLVPQGLEFLVT